MVTDPQLKSNPDLSLKEHCEAFEDELEVKVSEATTMSRRISRLPGGGWPPKKSPVAQEERDEGARGLWRWLAKHFDARRLVFVDESGTTYENYAYLVRKYIVPSLGRIKVKALTPAHVRAFYREKLDSGLALRTVQYLHTLLRKALKQAVRWGLVPRNATDAVDASRPVKKETRYFSFEQVKTFLEAASEDRFWALYVLALTTGLRRGELLGLRWEDVDLGREVLTVRRSLTPDGESYSQPKSAKGRRGVRLTPGAVEVLKNHKARQDQERSCLGNQWQEQGLVFPSQIGTPFNPSNLLNRSFKPLLKRAGLPTIRFHDLRHTFASKRRPPGQRACLYSRTFREGVFSETGLPV